MRETDCRSPSRGQGVDRRHSFFESSLRLPPTRTNESEAAAPGRRTLSGQASRRSGCNASKLTRSGPRGSLDAPSRSGSCFLIGLHIVYKYMRFSLDYTGARGPPGSPSLAGVATHQPSLRARRWAGAPGATAATGITTQNRTVTHRLLDAQGTSKLAATTPRRMRTPTSTNHVCHRASLGCHQQSSARTAFQQLGFARCFQLPSLTYATVSR
jgi:hypothetical protein